jgi:glyoxylase-like metal-dependent hydrolase (beta-lactamase superfamily II)
MRFWDQRTGLKVKEYQTRKGTKILQVLGGWCNVFLISRAGRNILVDTGPAPLGKKLMRNLDLAGIRHLDCLVMTHTHFDHAGNAARLKDVFGMPVIVHQSEATYLERGASPLPKGTMPFTKFIYNLGAPRVEDKFSVRGVHPDLTVDDTMDIGGFGVDARILHTPGHTKGSMSVIVDSEIAITGDTCVSVFPGRAFPPWADDPSLLPSSWEKLLVTGSELFLTMHHHHVNRKALEKELRRRR